MLKNLALFPDLMESMSNKHVLIKLSNAVYINKILKNHQWLLDEKPAAQFPIPMRGYSLYIHDVETAEPITDSKQQEYENELGFTYRQAIREIIYALVTCHPDISFAAIKLSQYSASPAQKHYDAVKDIYRYLNATKNDGIYYWQSQPRLDLPIGASPVCKSDGNYKDAEVATCQQHDPRKLKAAVDSDHAGDIQH